MQFPTNDWKTFFNQEQEKAYFPKLIVDVRFLYEQKPCFPNQEDIFQAFSFCELKNIKVIILGQDPYHTKGHAHGLAFSSKHPSKIPPSLRNIKKEMNNNSKGGRLDKIASQGVFFYNPILTVQEGKPGSHSNIGWKIFSENLFKYISNNKDNIIILLLGSDAKKYKHFFSNETYKFIITTHPSPLSAYRGFLNSQCFSKINCLLLKQGDEPINWTRSLQEK